MDYPDPVVYRPAGQTDLADYCHDSDSSADGGHAVYLNVWAEKGRLKLSFRRPFSLCNM